MPAPQKLASGELAWRFDAALPHRYGDIGWTDRGLVANGGWYPQPIYADGTLPIFDWQVTVHLPPERVGTLNAAAGSGTLTARQRADRVALSVFRQGVISEPVAGLRLLEHRRAEPGLARWLQEVWPEGAPAPHPEGSAGAAPLLIVEIGGYEQLATAGPGVVFLSDLAGRLSGGLRALHEPALRERAIEATLQDQGGWWAALEAAAMSPDGAGRVEQVLGWFSWNPVIDALLTDGTLPFYADIFREPRLPPPGVTRIVPPRTAPASAWAQAAGWIGRPLPELSPAPPPEPQPADPRAIPAWIAQNLPPAVVEGWGQPWPPGPAQNYRLIRTPEGLRAVRDAPPDAPAEIVSILTGGRDGEQTTVWVAGPGPAALDLPSGPARIDPDRLTVQSATADDHWPARFRLVAYGWVSGISLTALDADVFGQVMIRRDGDTRHLWYLALSHDQQDQIALIPGYSYAFGPLMDRRYRPGRLGLSASASLLDPGFRPTGAGAVALGLSTRISWDSRDEVHGQRLGLAVGVGTVPAETGLDALDARWLSLAGSAIQYVPLHPRHVLALRLSGGLASGEVEHRLLPLGGAGGVRAVPESAAVGHGLFVGSLEYRWALLRHASLPLGFGWLSGLQVCPGVDYGLLSGAVADPADPLTPAPDGVPSATGLSLTVLPVADLLGASPNALAITLAWPIQSEGIAGEGVQVYIDFGLSF